MNCRRVSNLMSAYIDGELTGAEMLEIRRHLSECDECNEEYDSIRMMKHAVSRLRCVTPREDLAVSIMARLDVVSIPAYQRAINAVVRVFYRKLSPVAAALAASGVALVLLSAGGMDAVKAPESDTMMASTYQINTPQAYSLSTVPGAPVNISYSRPLTVVNERPDINVAHIELASLTSH